MVGVLHCGVDLEDVDLEVFEVTSERELEFVVPDHALFAIAQDGEGELVLFGE